MRGVDVLGVKLQITLIVTIVLYFIVLLKLLKDKALNLKYTLLWFLSGLVMLVLAIFPDLLSWAISLVGIQDNMNGLFLILIGFLIIIVLSLTSIVSRQNRKIRTMIEEYAILEKRVRDLEAK